MGLEMEGSGELLSNGHRVSVQDECWQWMHSRVMDLMPLSCTLEMVKIVMFMFRVSYHT